MKILIPGGSGKVGTVLARAFHERGDDVVVLSRAEDKALPWRTVKWDGESLGDWVAEFEDADVIINLAGRSVNCLSSGMFASSRVSLNSLRARIST